MINFEDKRKDNNPYEDQTTRSTSVIAWKMND